MSDKTEEQLKREKALQVVKNAYHRLFSSDDGRIVLADMDSRFRLTDPVFVPLQDGNGWHYDPLRAAITDGMRQVPIFIHSILSQTMQGDGDISPKKKPTVRKK